MDLITLAMAKKYTDEAIVKAAVGDIDVESYVKDKIDDVIGGASDAFDTLAEVETALNNKVDKVAGKGLSTNDFTNAYKNKVDKAYLFGSFARGDETKSSDIDIRIVEDEGLSLIDLSYINFELKNKLNREVDVVATGGLDTRFLERIKSEEICIYENQ